MSFAHCTSPRVLGARTAGGHPGSAARHNRAPPLRHRIGHGPGRVGRSALTWCWVRDPVSGSGSPIDRCHPTCHLPRCDRNWGIVAPSWCELTVAGDDGQEPSRALMAVFMGFFHRTFKTW